MRPKKFLNLSISYTYSKYHYNQAWAIFLILINLILDYPQPRLLINSFLVFEIKLQNISLASADIKPPDDKKVRFNADGDV